MLWLGAYNSRNGFLLANSPCVGVFIEIDVEMTN